MLPQYKCASSLFPLMNTFSAPTHINTSTFSPSVWVGAGEKRSDMIQEMVKTQARPHLEVSHEWLWWFEHRFSSTQNFLLSTRTTEPTACGASLPKCFTGISDSPGHKHNSLSPPIPTQMHSCPRVPGFRGCHPNQTPNPLGVSLTLTSPLLCISICLCLLFGFFQKQTPRQGFKCK